MSSTTRKKQRATSSANAPEDHFISPLAHHLEEAHVHLHAALQTRLPKGVRTILQKMDNNLMILARFEAKRHGHDGVYG